MAGHLPQVIALHKGKVIGYTLAMTAAMEQVLPSLSPMFTEFKQCSYREKPLLTYPFVVGRQVCVDKNCRGRQLLSRLYSKTSELVSPAYRLCVTEIAERNQVSLKPT